MATTTLNPTLNPTPKPLSIRSDSRFPALCQAVRACWDSIGSDAMQALEQYDPDSPLDNADAVEMCMDADSLLMYPGGAAGKEANSFVRECAGTPRYAELAKALTKSCYLC